jgi:hypothetical protein
MWIGASSPSQLTGCGVDFLPSVRCQILCIIDCVSDSLSGCATERKLACTRVNGKQERRQRDTRAGGQLPPAEEVGARTGSDFIGKTLLLFKRCSLPIAWLPDAPKAPGASVIFGHEDELEALEVDAEAGSCW